MYLIGPVIDDVKILLNELSANYGAVFYREISAGQWESLVIREKNKWYDLNPDEKWFSSARGARGKGSTAIQAINNAISSQN